jgi:hypothetical protein
MNLVEKDIDKNLSIQIYLNSSNSMGLFHTKKLHYTLEAMCLLKTETQSF